MDYSQKASIELFKSGKFPGENGYPKHIETVISNVFVFDKKVYKFYKNDNDFFNKGFRDISSKEERFSFTKRDFEWNNALSPSIYTELIGISVNNGEIKNVKLNPEEIIIVMNRVDTHDMLFEKLMRKSITEEDCFQIGKQLAQNLNKIQKKLSGHNFYNLYKKRTDDLRSWIKSVTEYISEEESGMYCDFLEIFRTKNKDLFETKLSDEVTVDGDFHSHNAIYSKESFLLMDTFPPKEEWGVGHQLIPLYRIGTDIWALSGKKEFFESFIKGYESTSGITVDRKLDNLFIVYASGIAVSYLYMLQKTDGQKKEPAERFHKFIRSYFEENNLKSY